MFSLSLETRRALTIGFFMTGLFVIALLLLNEFGCTPAERAELGVAEGAGKVACAIVEAETDAGAADKICATANEIEQIVSTVEASRADASAPAPAALRSVRCRVIPTTAVCATAAETRAGIRAVLAERTDR